MQIDPKRKIQHKSFKVGDFRVTMEYANFTRPGHLPFEIWIANLNTGKILDMGFHSREIFDEFGERMVKDAVRRLK